MWTCSLNIYAHACSQPNLFAICRLEMEADYIGLLLMAEAGYDPRLAPVVYEDLERIEASYKEFTLGGFLRSHPPGRKRAKALARPKIMEEALTLYNDVRAKRGDES
jgi:predicted Zn-dependent protease